MNTFTRQIAAANGRRAGRSGGSRWVDMSSPSRRSLAALLAACVLTASLSGCAVAARALTTAEALSVLHDLAEGLPDESPAPVSDRSGLVLAVVTGTGGAGLRLNGSPGADRLTVLPDHTVVVVDCVAEGPTIDGPVARTPAWSHVTAPDGLTGYLSNGYLEIDPGSPAVPAC